MTDWTSLDYAVIHMKGTGQQPPDLVELAVVPIRSGVIGEPASWLVRPGGPIGQFANRIHGLTNEDVAGASLVTDIADQILAALDMAALVAHNAHVDVGVLTLKLAGWQPPEIFDTLQIARRLLPGRASYRLGALTSAGKPTVVEHLAQLLVAAPFELTKRATPDLLDSGRGSVVNITIKPPARPRATRGVCQCLVAGSSAESKLGRSASWARRAGSGG